MLDFPNPPLTIGQTFNSGSGAIYVWDGVAWSIATSQTATALTRNRVCNPCLQHSQEQGDTQQSGPVSAYAIADQWFPYFSTTGTLAFQRVQVVTPNGSKNRLRMTVNVADTSIAAGEYFTFQQPIEGIRTSDFRWGSAQARQVILRFGFKAPAGTYAVNVRNGADNRSYLANFTISAGQANVDTEQVFIIPGDTTGTWATDTGAGVKITITAAAGTTYQGVAGWQAGLFYGTAAISNGLVNAGAVFELFDIGLYLDPNNTGVPPRWEMPDEAQELAACMRYWERVEGTIYGYQAAGSYILNTIPFKVQKRTVPSMAAPGWGSTANAAGQSMADTTALSTTFQANAAATGTFFFRGLYTFANARM